MKNLRKNKILLKLLRKQVMKMLKQKRINATVKAKMTMNASKLSSYHTDILANLINKYSNFHKIQRIAFYCFRAMCKMLCEIKSKQT